MKITAQTIGISLAVSALIACLMALPYLARQKGGAVINGTLDVALSRKGD